MRLFYIDESGNTGASLNADQPIHWLIAVGVTPAAIKKIEFKMLNIASIHFPQRARHPQFEFHGSELFSGRGDCQGISPDNRIAIYKEILGLLKPHDCSIFVRGIDKAKYRDYAAIRGYEAKHPHELASQYLFEQIDEWLEQRRPASGEDVYGLLVADEQKEVARKTIENFAHWRDSATLGYRGRTLKFLIDTIHYVPSHDSWLIQLTDCVAFVRNRYAKIRREKGENAPNYNNSDKAIADLWESYCQKCVINDRVWP